MIREDRDAIRKRTLLPERECVTLLRGMLALTDDDRREVCASAAAMVRRLRDTGDVGLMEKFLAEYGLNTDEGVALMCLAEAYLRTPDAETLDALISDKIGEGDWSRHRGKANSALVNASTWALMLTGRVFRTIPAQTGDLAAVMRATVRRLGEPVARAAVGEAMRLMGRQFVLGRDLPEAWRNGAADREAGYLHSFDMLGEAARTARDAANYFAAYANAIAEIGKHASAAAVHRNPGISVKLSALHPRYEAVNRDRVLAELAPRLAELARLASSVNIPLAVDAEEADRLDLSLDVIEQAAADPLLAGWDGLGVVVQAYSRRCPAVIDWLYALAERFDRRFSVRLVKGAYWDAEIKNAQLLGIADFPVFTRKETTDLSYLACASKLLAMTDRLFPQFATHNAHTICAINRIAAPDAAFEFQRLHGMGEALHELARAQDGRRRRIYAPVGVHKDLLAYLVRRLLENGANSSFVHQILDRSVPPEQVVADPVDKVEAARPLRHPAILLPSELYGDTRRNSRGWNLNDSEDLALLDAQMAAFASHRWGDGTGAAISNPARPADCVGHVPEADAAAVDAAIAKASAAFSGWSATSAERRASMLEKASDLFEENAAELMALCVREAGKTRLDAIAEIREAVDFLRYYAAQARLMARRPMGVVGCISPWNFPLAIFTGQVAGALAAGNAVVAKPAEQTPLIATRAADLLHRAGIPQEALAVLAGDGATVGSAITGNPGIAGIAFTGSVETAAAIDRAMAASGNPDAPLIAETGGINAMIVDSTALPEQAVRDIVTSAFQSAGQRCSALRVLFVQKDVAPAMLRMLEGATRELRIGDPWDPATDVGPVIDEDARRAIADHCDRLEREGRLLFRLPLPESVAAGTYAAPAAFRLDAISELQHEVFGPVLHVVEYGAEDLDNVVDAINATGYGLTLGIHSRIDTRIDHICARARIGNIYVNRNQIGAVVGVQPFGGEGLSGTGPKAGGPHYATRFTIADSPAMPEAEQRQLPGPTGERDSYGLTPRGLVACTATGADAVRRQVELVEEAGCRPLVARPGTAQFDTELALGRIEAVMVDGPVDRAWRQLLAAPDGRRIPVVRCDGELAMLFHERSISEDTTASGGNASLLSAAS